MFATSKQVCAKANAMRSPTIEGYLSLDSMCFKTALGELQLFVDLVVTTLRRTTFICWLRVHVLGQPEKTCLQFC